MALDSRSFKVRLTEHPFVNDKSDGTKAPIGRFDTKRKYRVLSIYGTDQFTDFLLADEDGYSFGWNRNSVRKVDYGYKCLLNN
jgi:hypothetical protein